jgi:hypothetical protein
MKFYCDSSRHIVCVPYSVENLHAMADALGIKRCWYHAGASYPHYDMPKKRVVELTAKCELVDSRAILRIAKGETP